MNLSISFSRPGWLLAGWWCLAPAMLPAGEKVLVAGDSLTKEYRAEFPVLFPSNPAAWTARNWIEILDQHRNSQFDLGSWEVFPDWRLTGHAFNWAKPGGTVREFRNLLRQTADAEAEVRASSGGDLVWLAYPGWRNTFANATGQAQKLVIFFGGNDLALGNSDPVANPVVNGSRKQMDYESIYAGTFGEASNPDNLRASIRSNLKSVIQWFRDPNGTQPPRFTGPMILCAVPHVGCTPKVQQDAGTVPARTAVLTQMTGTLNAEMKEYAATKDVGFADVYPVTKAILDPGTFRIGGVSFIKAADDDCRTRYLFSGDGFHPNTAVHAKVAQIVVDAFLTKYPALAPSLPRLSDREIITTVLGLPADTGYQEWVAAAGVTAGQRGPLSDPDKDGVPNALEYALAGFNPAAPDAAPPLTISRSLPGSLSITWQPRFEENAYCDLVPQVAARLQNWQPVSTAEVTRLPDGRRQVTWSLTAGGSRFFRLAAVTY